MSVTVFLNVWMASDAKASDRLTLLALAEAATPSGKVQVSARDLADAAHLSLGAVNKAMKALLDAGEIEVLTKGTGKVADKYRIAERYCQSVPEVAAFEPPSPIIDTSTLSDEDRVELRQVGNHMMFDTPVFTIQEPVTAVEQSPAALNAVEAVLEAAGVTAPPSQPFYWLRVEHQTELDMLLRSRKTPQVNDLCAELIKARNRGISAPANARSIRAIVAHMLGAA